MKRDNNLFIVSSLDCSISNKRVWYITELSFLDHFEQNQRQDIRGDYFEMQHFALSNDFSH